MVSADNLNLDLLIEICSSLSPTDLTSACLVSKSFHAGAVRQLYYAIHFRVYNLKKWPDITSPFSTILARPELARYVQSCEITAIPPFKHRLHYKFLETCVESLSICHNIHTLIFMTQHPVLMEIVRIRKHLHKLQFQFENISSLDADTFSQITGLQTLILHRAPVSICQRLPSWIDNVSTTLRTLVINNTRYLNEDLLIDIAKRVSSQLRAFHINNCSLIPFGYILRAAVHLPLLESLGFSIGMYISNLKHDFPKQNLPNLHHIVLNMQPDLSSFKPNLSLLLELFFDSISDSPIFSITCKFSNYIIFPNRAVSKVVLHFGSTLRKFNLVQAEISGKDLASLTQTCKNLTQLSITTLQVVDITSFITPLALSSSLHTLIIFSERDSGILPGLTSSTASWSASHIRYLFRCIPSVQKVITNNRCWTREHSPSSSNISHQQDDLFIKVTPIKHVS